MNSPVVYVVQRPTFDVERFLAFLAVEGLHWNRTPDASDAEQLVEAAGRICYMSFGPRQSPKVNAKYLMNLIAMGHESVLEHVSWSFVLTGISRALTHQLVRHRVGVAFSQLSQQYHDESEASFIVPSWVSQSEQAAAAWNTAINEARNAYKIISNMTVPDTSGTPEDQRRELRRAWRSAARSVMPNATETKLFMTANARALRHLFDVRGSTLGDLEMRAVMVQMLEHVSSDAPALFADFQIRSCGDGTKTIVRA